MWHAGSFVVTCRISLPDQEPLHWEHRVLAIGPPVKSLWGLLFSFIKGLSEDHIYCGQGNGLPYSMLLGVQCFNIQISCHALVDKPRLMASSSDRQMKPWVMSWWLNGEAEHRSFLGTLFYLERTTVYLTLNDIPTSSLPQFVQVSQIRKGWNQSLVLFSSSPRWLFKY